MRIIFSGGGTIGSVSPLIALFEEIKTQKSDTEFLWVATRKGRELDLIKKYNIPVKSIFAGKLRRYFSFQNFIDPFLGFFGFIQSLFIISKFKPDVIVSAGSFVSVPVSFAAKFLRKKQIIHQQDVQPGLANQLMARATQKITITFEKSLKDFFKDKTVLTGNPVREDILAGDKDTADKIFNLELNLPTILIVGGGTGALAFNDITNKAVSRLVEFCQVIHLTGGKIDVKIKDSASLQFKHSRYHVFEFLTNEMKHAYAAADLVVSRAGMSALTELSALGKASIVIPIPNSHQEKNAIEFFRQNAIVYVKQQNLTPEGFAQAIKELLEDDVTREGLGRNIKNIMPQDATKKITQIIFELAN